jgi:NAD(P)-dependent dehydrogenase (short-subunit alcohol dehydrogenase family)
MPLLTFDNRVALVTGAGRGIGRSHALMLAARGARVVVNDIAGANGESPVAALVQEIHAAGGEAVASTDSVVTGADAIVQTAIDAFGQLDIVVNNAGIQFDMPFAQTSIDDWRRVFDIHFFGTVQVTRAAWPHLVRSGSGRVIGTASSGMLGNAGITVYGAAKAATWGLMNSLAIEGRPHGITVNTILPTAKTRMIDYIDDPVIAPALAKYFQPDHISALVVWLVHQDTQVTNATWQVSAGRAGRMTFAAWPTVRVGDSTPEIWAAQNDALSVDGVLTALGSTAAMFGDELADADPEIARMLGGADGGFGTKLIKGSD